MATETIIEKITTAFDKHVDVINSIMHDCVESGLVTEVETACQNFQSILKDFDTDESTKVGEFIKKMDDLELDENEFAELAETVVNHDDFDSSAFLEKMDESEIADWLAEKGYICVKLQTMDQVAKLKTFVETEIYPAVNEQAEFLKF